MDLLVLLVLGAVGFIVYRARQAEAAAPVAATPGATSSGGATGMGTMNLGAFSAGALISVGLEALNDRYAFTEAVSAGAKAYELMDQRFYDAATAGEFDDALRTMSNEQLLAELDRLVPFPDDGIAVIEPGRYTPNYFHSVTEFYTFTGTFYAGKGTVAGVVRQHTWFVAWMNARRAQLAAMDAAPPVEAPNPIAEAPEPVLPPSPLQTPDLAAPEQLTIISTQDPLLAAPETLTKPEPVVTGTVVTAIPITKPLSWASSILAGLRR